MLTFTFPVVNNRTKHVKPKKTNLNAAIVAYRKAQLTEFKQALTEAILIGRGDIKGTPLSELWNE